MGQCKTSGHEANSLKSITCTGILRHLEKVDFVPTEPKTKIYFIGNNFSIHEVMCSNVETIHEFINQNQQLLLLTNRPQKTHRTSRKIYIRNIVLAYCSVFPLNNTVNSLPIQHYLSIVARLLFFKKGWTRHPPLILSDIMLSRFLVV